VALSYPVSLDGQPVLKIESLLSIPSLFQAYILFTSILDAWMYLDRTLDSDSIPVCKARTIMSAGSVFP
jgi:hypothetical protein